MINVAGGRELLDRLVAEITQLLTVLGNFAAALNGDKPHQHWHPPQRVSDALFRLTGAPDGKIEPGLQAAALTIYI